MEKYYHLFGTLLILTLFTGCSDSKSGSNTSPRGGNDPSEFASQPGDCKKFIASLPASFFYDWVSVPENQFDQASPHIRIFYYGPKNLTDNVVIFYNGGPGSDSHGTADPFTRKMNELNLSQKISMIYTDQRGTGCSSPYPNKNTTADILRARWYGSTGIVYDSEAIRMKLLGAKKWKIFGQSFGAFIVHRYVSLFPESLKGAYAHANAINIDPAERSYNRIYSQYRVLNNFLEKYPEHRSTLVDLKKYMTSDKCFETKYVGKICGHELQSYMIPLLGFSNRWPTLNSYLKLFRSLDDSGGFQMNDTQIKLFIEDYADFEEAAAGQAFSVISYYDRNTRSLIFENCRTVYAKLSLQNIAEDQLLLNECMPGIQHKYSSENYLKIKELLNFKTDNLTHEKFKIGLLRMPEKSFHLYSGQYDAFVPFESFKEELNVVGNLINYTHFPNSGHEGYRTERQIWDDLAK